MAEDAATPKCKPVVLKFNSEEEVAVALAKYIANLSAKFIQHKSSFTVVLSGGTIIDTLRKLLEPPYFQSVDWSKWMIFFLDERILPLNHTDSNYKLAYDGFLSKVPIPQCNIYAISEKLSPEAAADDYEARLKHLVDIKKIPLSSASRFPKFDLMLVGMRPNGHVASLFFWHFERYKKKRWVTSIKYSPKPPSERITFTFPLINASSRIALVVTGDDVAHAVKIALASSSFDHIPLPIQMVSPEGELTWFLDKDAASKL